jgi:predicted permease
MACANVANLLLSRATRRAQEMALRSALGASRLRLVRQLTIECLLLALGGGAVGLLLASGATTALGAYGSRQLPRIADVRVDAPVLCFTFGMSLLTVVLFGVLPAFRVSRVDLAASLKDMTRSSDGRGRNSLRRLLVTVELALAFVLLMGAALLGKSFLRLTSVNPGYDPRNVLTLGVHVYGERYWKPEVQLGFYQQVLGRLRVTVGVESAAMVSTLPLAGFDRRGFHIQDRPLTNPSDAPPADTYSVSTDYFRVMRIPLKRGRLFTEADRQGAPGVTLISESCARAMFPDRDPIGAHIQLGGRDPKNQWLRIVGVVGDVRQHRLDLPSRMEAYIAQTQEVGFGYSLVVRTAGDPRRMEKTVRDVMLAVDPTQPAYHVHALEDYVSDSLAERSLILSLLGVFGGLALLLAAVGIYGVISYAVSARTRELGIRMALGASRRDVLSMVLRQGMILIAAGLPIGLGASLVLDRFLATLLYDVEATDPMTALATAVGLSAVALLATIVPANRAMRIDPVAALR